MPKPRVKKRSAQPTRKPVAKLAPKKAPKPAPKPVTIVQFEPKARVVGEASSPGSVFPVELDPRRVEETLNRVRGEVVNWANKGRHTKVRFRFRGKQLLPDLPLAAVIAAEGLTFYWGGILRALMLNFAGTAVLDVELVNDSEKRVLQGRELLGVGDLDGALEHFRAALAIERDCARAHLNIGIVLRMKGDLAGARTALERARSLDVGGPVGLEADRVLAGIRDGEPTEPHAFPPRP